MRLTQVKGYKVLQPVSYVLNSNFVKTNCKNDKQVFAKDIQNNNQTELSNYEVGQAILNRNNISFRNLSQPIEVTDRYNKKIEGKDHLDLPNIHMYEYPDTNLIAVINIDNNIDTNDNDFLKQPQIIMQIIDNTQTDKNNKLEKQIIKQIIEKKMNSLSINVINNIIENNLTFYSYTECYGKNVIQNFKQLNNTFFNLKFDEKELLEAKKELKNLNHNKEIDSVSLSDLQNYYNNLRNNFSANAYVTVSKQYFDKNKVTLFSELNDNIDFKLQKTNLQNSSVLYNYLLKEFTIAILNSYKNFNKDFLVSNNSNNNQETEYKVIYRNKLDEKYYKAVINQILQENMQDILKEIKRSYIRNTQKILTQKNFLPLIKNVTLAKLNNNSNNIPNILNYITENNIKLNIVNNFINQKPVFEELDKTKNKDN